MAQSPELAGGAGFTFEDAVAATYLTALLQEGFAPGVEDRTVHRVALQQRDFGEPLDDIIVDFRSDAGALARLSLQVKRSLTISDAPTNADFRDVVRDCWGTLNKMNFRKGTDRYGAVVGDITSGTARDLRLLCEFARASTTTTEFEARFAAAGNASVAVRRIRDDIAALVKETLGATCSDQALQEFLAHLVLIEFDFLHEGGTSRPTALNSLRSTLATEEASQAPALWDSLNRLAREGAGKSAIFDRSRLVRNLSDTFRLASAPSLRKDMQKLTSLARQWLADIEDDVGGTRLDRAELAAELNQKLKRDRWVHIRGLPGSGKSVLLRRRAEADLLQGPVLFLKSGRLEGSGWASFAAANGLSSATLTDLLVEIGATGSSTLYIDGIDRVEKQHQSIILDVVRALIEDPLLENWRVVVSLRDTGIEPLRNWLGQLLAKTGIGTVEVKVLDDQEAELLAKAKPHLKALLFGPNEVQEIVRRPFFAKILNQNFGSSAGDDAFQPQSEVDLISNWWKRGGYNSGGQSALERQRAIVELGSLRARHLERDIAVSELKPTTVGVIDQLISDGILQHTRIGHSLRFSHDIFFEWAFFHTLADRDSTWLDEIRASGEPPAVARVVELLSQWQFGQGAQWGKTLHEINSSKMRSQWTRAWLLAPLSAPNFKHSEATFSTEIEAKSWHFLKKTVVWFQAEKTTPNPGILAGELPQEERIRVADLLGWPADFKTWSRFIVYLLTHASSIPAALYPDMLSVFEVWQNALAGIENSVSNAILNQAADWLQEIELEGVAKAPPPITSRWASIGSELGDFRQSLTRLVLRSSTARPDLTTDFLTRVISSDRLRRKKFEEIILFSPILAQSHPKLLADLTLMHLKQELPEDKNARERREFEQSIDTRNRALAIPLEKRSRNEQMAAENHFVHLGMHSFSSYDWDSLSIDRDTHNYFPASPLREPFHSLFTSAPDQAIRLVSELSNHAMTAWRQLHSLSHDNHGTPIPIQITFPWGDQLFWGGDKEYLWHRGMWAPKALACGYLAFEDWAIRELERGRSADELVKQIVVGNEAIAVLGIAVAVVLQIEAISEMIFSVVTCQRLLGADHVRWSHDFTDSMSNLIGFMNKSDMPHIEAVKRLNARVIRQRNLRSLVPLYFLNASYQKRTKALVDDFVNNLPFQIEEHRSLPEAQTHLQKQALEYAELVSIENYRQVPIPEGEAEDRIAIVHVSPTATSPAQVVKADEARKRLREGSLWVWCSKYFESGQLGEAFTLSSAMEFAKETDSLTLFKATENDELVGMRRGAVAATAAIILDRRANFSQADLAWARNILERANSTPEKKDVFWSPSSVIPWHQSIFVARGLSSDLRHGTANLRCTHNLLALVAHPLEAVSLAALESTLSLWDQNPRLGWSGLHLALSLCAIPARSKPRGPSDDMYSKKEVKSAIKEALHIYKMASDWPDLPLPPTAWVRVTEIDGRKGLWHDHEDEYDTSDFVDPNEQWAPSPTYWYSQKAAKIFALIPTELVLKSAPAPKFLELLDGQLSWLISKFSPPWVKPGSRDRSQSNEFEWTHELGRSLGKIAGHRSLADIEARFLDPIFALEGENCWALLAPLVDIYICAYVYDIQTMPKDAVPLLERCLDRLLKASEFKSSYHSGGELHGFDQPSLAKSLMFVSVERAALAARYANGDWSEVDRILPVVDRYVRSAGWASTIMSHFLTLCERSKTNYPAGIFAKQVLEVIGGKVPLKGWHGTFLPARIAGLVQHFAHRETPMPLELGQDLLRILDLLVDMGDRRSAALQLNESFREIRTA